MTYYEIEGTDTIIIYAIFIIHIFIYSVLCLRVCNIRYLYIFAFSILDIRAPSYSCVFINDIQYWLHVHIYSHIPLIALARTTVMHEGSSILSKSSHLKQPSNPESRDGYKPVYALCVFYIVRHDRHAHQTKLQTTQAPNVHDEVYPGRIQLEIDQTVQICITESGWKRTAYGWAKIAVSNELR